MVKPFRVSFNAACELLSVKRDGLYKLIKSDSTFPKMIKEGDTKQAACYFDYKELEDWWQAKVHASQSSPFPLY